MSAGQKPRWREFFPRMKRRGLHRGRGIFIVQYDAESRPVWPPAYRHPDIDPECRRYPHPRSGRRPRPPVPYPNVDDLLGADPDWLAGQSVDEYIAEIREEAARA